ncbi:MAG: hypothetical protein H7210_01755 [Pyrinomonadaceae bacterium]|nr:hypothetical protein [Phycisphaerales bacterium]
MAQNRLMWMALLGSMTVAGSSIAQQQPTLKPLPSPVKSKPGVPTPIVSPSPVPAEEKLPAPPDSAAPAKEWLETDQPGVKLGVVAEFRGVQCTGIAVSKTGRVFACFPRWNEEFKHSLVEVAPDGSLTPYPNDVWNGFVENDSTVRGMQFVCVQSIAVDDEDRLWVLDAASPRMEGVNRSDLDGGGPKLIEFDLTTNKMRRMFRVLSNAALAESYLNDFQLDPVHNVAYVSDSGTGAIVVINTQTGATKRFLEQHSSTKADAAYVPVIEGRELRGKDGKVPQIHVDGIALDRKNGYLYYQALTGKRMFRISTKVLLDALPGRTLTGEQKNTISGAVEDMGETVMTDGIIFDDAGNLYFSALEQNGIVVRTPAGELKDLIKSPVIKWPDSFAIAAVRPGTANGANDSAETSPQLYFTTSQIHLTDRFSADGTMPKEPYRVLRTKLFGR